ncbi:MAG: exodeoxyribonuclease VII small subunit [Clostridia bacterium]|nr:exodeoxyribonuclease VII small subunit [Clostridia bacterium]
MKKNLTFEEAIASIEGTVAKLEGGTLTLDESLAAFEEAVGLIKLCNEKLSGAEQRVKMLIEGADGSVTDVPFNTGNDEA